MGEMLSTSFAHSSRHTVHFQLCSQATVNDHSCHQKFALNCYLSSICYEPEPSTVKDEFPRQIIRIAVRFVCQPLSCSARRSALLVVETLRPQNALLRYMTMLKLRRCARYSTRFVRMMARRFAWGTGTCGFCGKFVVSRENQGRDENGFSFFKKSNWWEYEDTLKGRRG